MPNDTQPGITPPPPPGTVPPPPPKPETSKSKRSTTRAGRRAETAARRAAGGDKAPTSTKRAASTARKAALETRLTDALVGLGLGVRGVGVVIGSDPIDRDGVLIVKQGPIIGEALNRVADQDPKVKAALERVLTVSVYGQLLSAVLPLAVGIAANHGMVPPQLAALMGDAGQAEAVDKLVAEYRTTHPDATQAELERVVMEHLASQAAAAPPAAA